MINTRIQLGEYELWAFQVLRLTYQTFNFLLCRDGRAVLIDCGEAKPALKILEKENLQLTDILITHNHNDHKGGCRKLQDQLGVQSTSPAVETFDKEVIGTRCRSISTPGHLAIHKSYYFPELNVVFTADTIINGAVGRMMTGTPEQYWTSLNALCELPADTRIFGGHDYLKDNMKFALSIEPENEAYKRRLELYENDPVSAIFMTLEDEKKSNPFLGTKSPEAFAALRRKKDRF